MTDATVVSTPQTHLTPTESAISDLVRLTLHQQADRQVTDRPSGQAVAQLCELAAIPHSRTLQVHVRATLIKLEATGKIKRDMNARRTFMIELVAPLSAEEERQLAQRAIRNRDALSTDKSDEVEIPPEHDQLVKLCLRVYAAIQAAAKVAPRKDGRYVALNITGITKSLGIKTAIANEARHYLRKQELIKSIKACDDDTLLWWWKISQKPLDVSQLIEHAIDPSTSYESSRSQKSAGHEDSPHERRFAGAAPAVLPSALCGPVTISHVTDKEEDSAPAPVVSSKTPTPGGIAARMARMAATIGNPKAAPTSPLPPTDTRMQRLIEIIRRLETEKIELQQELTTLRTETTAEIKELRETVKELEDKAEAETAATKAADLLIEQYGK